MIFKQGDRLINSRNWSELVKPEQVTRTSEFSDTQYGKFVCEPLERGYGTALDTPVEGLASLGDGGNLGLDASGS